MTNLIPPQAKKQVTHIYWLRQLCAWMIVWSVAFCIGLLLLWPTYLLLSGTNAAYIATAASATERTATFDEMVTELNQSNDQARRVIVNQQAPNLSGIISDVWDEVRVGVSISGISIARQDNLITPFTVTGEASDRQTLAAFRDRIVALPFVESVNLPIENLAQNQDISFTLTVTFNPQGL